MTQWLKWTLKFILWTMVDVLCLSVAYAPSFILHGTKPLDRPVLCADRSIQKLVRKPSINEESWAAINMLPAAIFGIGELITNWSHFNQSFYRIASIFTLGSLASNSLTYLAKVSTGHLRPDFFDTCRFLSEMHRFCKEGVWQPQRCDQAWTPKDAIELRMSFYSFFSSHVMYYMVFTVFYLEARMQGRPWMRLLRPTIQSNLLLLAVWVGYTRVYDHRCHLQDVWVGLLQGALLAALFLHFSSPGLFRLGPEDPAAEGGGDAGSQGPAEAGSEATLEDSVT